MIWLKIVFRGQDTVWIAVQIHVRLLTLREWRRQTGFPELTQRGRENQSQIFRQVCNNEAQQVRHVQRFVRREHPRVRVKRLSRVGTRRNVNNRRRGEGREGPGQVVVRGVDGGEVDDGIGIFAEGKITSNSVKSSGGGRTKSAWRRDVQQEERFRAIRTEKCLATHFVDDRNRRIFANNYISTIGRGTVVIIWR